MAPNNNNNNKKKKETPNVLGSVSQYSSRYNAGAARRNDGKRGQASSTSGTVRKKVHEDEDSGPTSTGNGSGDAEHLPSGSASTNRLPSGRQTVYEHLPSGGVSLIRLPSGRQPVYEHSSSDSVSLIRLPSGRQNNHGHLPSSSVSMVTPLPSNVRGENDVAMKGPEPSERPSHGQTVISKDEDGNVGTSTRESEFDEFPDSDLDGLLEADIEQLIGPALSRAPVVDEDDGQKASENVVEEFLDSDMDSLSETDIQRLLGQAVPKSAKAVDGNDSEAPVVDVGESNLGVESIDTDALIMDKDRIDMYVEDVEDVEEGGLEFLLDEIFTQHGNPTAAAVKQSQSQGLVEEISHIAPAERPFYNRIYVVCDLLCQFARDEKEWSSARSPFTFYAWSWFRNAEAGRLTDMVFNFVFPAARQILSADSLDMVHLLSLPEPRLDDLVDSCNNPGVYVFVCHARRLVHPQSGCREAIDNNTVASYTGQSIAKPREDGYQGMSLRFNQHRREMRRSIPELEDNAQRVSATVPRLYRTVVENNLEKQLVRSVTGVKCLKARHDSATHLITTQLAWLFQIQPRNKTRLILNLFAIPNQAASCGNAELPSLVITINIIGERNFSQGWVSQEGPVNFTDGPGLLSRLCYDFFIKASVSTATNTENLTDHPNNRHMSLETHKTSIKNEQLSVP
ncbi:hypothetical protein FDENT_1791 [Fusarium denticulatum]|uniref:Uncharacterized protein n=1 Tax=Fusarium denticulatum TaxID=48507 RepID=A0A8H5XHQ9_9HYPO|nr:hypothetical protein FDENT_1791 [Fusarium denticulatum]